LRLGLYLSPWDRNNPTYGDSPRYNDLYCEQLTELLTHYGKVAEVWFDGANGEGPNGKRQVYDWPRVWSLVRRLQPEAVMFSDAGPDVRWCGNERGTAGDPNWSTVDPAIVTYPGADGPGITDALQHGNPSGTVWRPAEVDVSIRPGWFYHPAEDARVRTADNLVNLYSTSVGHNGKLLLNVPPTRDGVIHSTDVARLTEFRARLTTTFARDVATGATTSWKVTGSRSATFDIELNAPTKISAARLEEDITHGQRVAAYRLEADGQLVVRGTTIGYTKIDRFPEVTTRRVRLAIETVDAPERPVVRLYSP
jgi:alpha-L-fucosidase